MAPLLFLFNGGVGSGKDTAVAALLQQYPGSVHHSFKAPLVDAACRMYGVTHEWWEQHYTRTEKETPQAELWGRSPRAALIHLAEDVLKPLFGRDCLAQVFVDTCPLTTSTVFEPITHVFCSDAGFVEEVETCCRSGRFAAVFVVRLERPNTTDISRTVLSKTLCPDAWWDTIANDSDCQTFVERVLTCVQLWGSSSRCAGNAIKF